MIIGCAGAGKSTLGPILEEMLNLPLIHMDKLFWKPGWVASPKAEWADHVRALSSGDSWIMDGNYGGTMDIRLQMCDTVLFLDFPRYLCLFRVLKRSILHLGRSRPDLNAGCPEKLPDLQFLKWIWYYRKRNRPAIIEKLTAAEAEGKRVYIMRSPRELNAVVEQLSARH